MVATILLQDVCYINKGFFICYISGTIFNDWFFVATKGHFLP